MSLPIPLSEQLNAWVASLPPEQSRYGFIKSRKTSCTLCSRRKTKCHKEPSSTSCVSCIKRGVTCVYNIEEQLSVVSQQAGPSTTRATGTTAQTPAPMPQQKKAIRERILSGYNSSSDEDEVAVVIGETSVGVSTKEADSQQTENAGEAATAQGSPNSKDEDEQADTIQVVTIPSKSKAKGTTGKRPRGPSEEDELSGELLELASAPKPKKKAAKSSKTKESSRPDSRARSPQASLSPTPGSAPHTYNPYTTSLLSLLSTLPSPETQTILFNTFFTDPFLPSGISLLRPQYLEDFKIMLKRQKKGKLRNGDATTLANALVFLASSLRIMPGDTSRLLLSAVPTPLPTAIAEANGLPSSPTQGPVYPRSLSRILAALPPLANDPAPLHQRYFDLALIASQVAEQHDQPSVMLVMLKLVKYRYSMLSRFPDRTLAASSYLAQGMKVAQALGMSKEWDGIPQGERELRRRVMWALYVADRQHSYITGFPYSLHDQHSLIALPSTMSEHDLYEIPSDATTLPPHSPNSGPTSSTTLFVEAHLARITTPLLDTFVTLTRTGTPHELVLRFDASLSAFQEALPDYFAFPPHTRTEFDAQHAYLPAHRIHLHSRLLDYRLGIHRAHLPQYLDPSTPAAARKLISQLCILTLRVHRSAGFLDAKVASRLFRATCVFEAAATLCLVMHVEKVVGRLLDISDEWRAFSAGLRDALELLDGVGTWPEFASFSHKGAAVLREMKTHLGRPHSATTRGKTLLQIKADIATATRASSAPAPTPAAKQSAPLSFEQPAPRGKSAKAASNSPVPTGSPEEIRIREWLSVLRCASMEHLMRDVSVAAWEPIILGM